VRGDIRNGDLVAHLFKSKHIDSALHPAAESHVDRSLIEPNIHSTQALLHRAADHCAIGKFRRQPGRRREAGTDSPQPVLLGLVCVTDDLTSVA
jgi:dTDP-D-glucose 4,6-dehydratase